MDDIEQEGMRDRVVLERLARNAVRVTLVEGVTVEAAVRRVKLEDALKSARGRRHGLTVTVVAPTRLPKRTSRIVTRAPASDGSIW